MALTLRVGAATALVCAGAVLYLLRDRASVEVPVPDAPSATPVD